MLDESMFLESKETSKFSFFNLFTIDEISGLFSIVPHLPKLLNWKHQIRIWNRWKLGSLCYPGDRLGYNPQKELQFLFQFQKRSLSDSVWIREYADFNELVFVFDIQLITTSSDVTKENGTFPETKSVIFELSKHQL